MKIAVLCTLSPGLFAIEHAINLGVKIDRIIGLRPNATRDEMLISGYTDIKHFCKKKKINYIYVDDYSLKKEDAYKLLNKIDLLWVNGWQRLIPNEFISFTKIGAVGAHGSCDGITLGRGRSPQNWALLIGAKTFEISVFKISSGIDDGAVITSNKFNIDITDNIQTSYIKVSLCVASCIAKIYADKKLVNKALPQNGLEEYFPKRIPSDGAIDWKMDLKDIYNQIRALTDPYPNARTFLGKNEIMVKQSIPIFSDISYNPGYITHKFPNGEFLVAAKGGYLLIKDYTTSCFSDLIEEGKTFRSMDMQIIVNQIVSRFKNEFPQKKLNRSLTYFWKSRGLKINS